MMVDRTPRGALLLQRFSESATEWDTVKHRIAGEGYVVFVQESWLCTAAAVPAIPRCSMRGINMGA